MTHGTVQSSHEELYRCQAGHPEIVDVPDATFLMIDGQGDPNTSDRYAGAIQALYTTAYTLRFTMKKAIGSAARVAPLEGLWFGAEADGFSAASKDRWRWTMMIRLPESAPADLVGGAIADAERKKPELPIGDLRVERFAEGRAAQVMHIGPYADEQPTVAALHGFIAQQGYRLRGKHHEIYLGDPRRAAPSKLKTLIRQPVSE